MAVKVLVVDDALFMRKLLRGILEGAGYEIVAEASDGREALCLYRDLRPDLVTMDIVMPEMTGLEALAAIREIDPAARVIMCSAMGQESFVEEAMQGGAQDFILKPFNPRKVAEVLARVTGA